MKILMLSWEFPPKIIGGIARHVHDLSLAIARQGVDVHVITCGMQGALAYEEMDGVKVYRVDMQNPSPPDFLTWVMQLNLNMLEQANKLALRGIHCDIVHAHDWLAAYAGKNLKNAWQVPLISTIHATEYGRNSGLHNDLQRYISDVEWWLGYESWRVICCSRYMQNELQWVFQIPKDKVRIIPNGVYPKEFETTSLPIDAARNRYCAPDEKLIFHVGRIVREKGLGTLIEAFARVVSVEPKAKLVVAGKGPYLDEVKHRAYQYGVYNRIYFAGYIDDNTRNALYQCADVVVFPSLYEPFGIVALEGMAAGAPIIVSDCGGLGEIVNHGVNGLKAYCGNPGSLADNILWALRHPDHTIEMKRQALGDVKNIYNWDKIAGETITVYDEVITQQGESPWQSVMHEQTLRNDTMSRMTKVIDAEEMSRYRDVH